VALLRYASIPPAYQEGLYIPEKHLFYLAMETLIYEKREKIGILSTSAQPFYPPTVEEKKPHKNPKKNWQLRIICTN